MPATHPSRPAPGPCDDERKRSPPPGTGVAPGPPWCHTETIPHTKESPAISKRKPPSQRPERKMDETALAIARLRDDAKPDKSSEPDRPPSAELKAKKGLARNITGHQKAVGGAPSASTKRPKTFGS